MRILLILASTFLSSLLLAELMKKVALRFDIVDKPNTDLKTHKRPLHTWEVALFLALCSLD